MAQVADRTLVKSPPELWGLVDNPELMERWCRLLAGGSDRVPVTVTSRSDGERIAWRSADPAGSAAIELSLLEKGFGTKVTISARSEPPVSGDTLESLLDELGSPQRRPFARG